MACTVMKKDAFASLSGELSLGLDAALSDSSKKVTQLLGKVLPLILDNIDPRQDLLSLRQVSRGWKEAVDRYWISEAPKGFLSSTVPRIHLPDHKTVDEFMRSMVSFRNPNLGPIPFELVVGVGMLPGDLLNVDLWEWDEMFIQMYWNTVYKCVGRIGQRISGIILDIRVPNELSWSLGEHTVKVVMNCLKQMSNLEYLTIHPCTTWMENLFADYYKTHQSRNRSSSKLKKLPYLKKLTYFQIVTIGQTNFESESMKKKKVPPKPTSFTWRFLLQHGENLKILRVFSTLAQVKTMGVLKVPNLEELRFEIRHIGGDGIPGEDDKDVMGQLPRVEVNKDKLEWIVVSLNWTWRACDIAGFLKWLANNFPGEEGHCLKWIVLKTTGVLYNIEDDEEDDYWDSSWSEGWTTSSEDELLELIAPPKKVKTAKGKDHGSKEKMFNFSSWIGGLKLPKVRNILVDSEYKGSWRWLSAFPRGSVDTLRLHYRLEDPQMAYQKGFLKTMLQEHGPVNAAESSEMGEEEIDEDIEDGLVWNYFPNLKELILFWPKWSDLLFWGITREFYEEYLEEQRAPANKDGEEPKKKRGMQPKEALMKISPTGLM